MSVMGTITVATIKAPIHFLPSGEGGPAARFVPRMVSIRNARPIAAKLSLDREGFELVEAPRGFADFRDADAVRGRYYPEVERVLRAVTGAARVIAFHHDVRGAAGEPNIGEPVSRAHSDFTASSGHERARRELAARGVPADPLFFGHFAIVSLWQPIERAVETWPLALCDAATLDPARLVASDLIPRDRAGETASLVFGTAQRWYYFPRLTPGEAIAIKGYDSREDGAARFTAHAAIHDPTAPADAAGDDCIETRALVIYPD